MASRNRLDVAQISNFLKLQIDQNDSLLIIRVAEDYDGPLTQDYRNWINKAIFKYMEPDNNKYKILLEATSQRFDAIANADNTLDQKAGTLMGFEITLAIGVLTWLINQLSDIKLFEAYFAVFLLFLSVILLLYISWPKKYLNASVDLKKNQGYLNVEEKPLLLQLISDKNKAIDDNSEILKRKTKMFKIAIVLLVISFILLMLSQLNKFYV